MTNNNSGKVSANKQCLTNFPLNTSLWQIHTLNVGINKYST